MYNFVDAFFMLYFLIFYDISLFASFKPYLPLKEPKFCYIISLVNSYYLIATMNPITGILLNYPQTNSYAPKPVIP